MKQIITLQQKRFDKLASTYESKYGLIIMNNWMNVKITKFIRETFGALSTAKIFVELGCGTGKLLKEIDDLKIPNTQLIGVDISQKMLNLTKKKVPQAKIIKDDFYDIKLPKESVDIAIMQFALHHTGDKILPIIGTELKDGGYFIIADLLGYKNQAVNKFFNKVDHVREPSNYWFRNEDEIVGLIKKFKLKKTLYAKKKFKIDLKRWLDEFNNPQKTLNLFLNASRKMKEKLGIKNKINPTITLPGFVLIVKK